MEAFEDIFNLMLHKEYYTERELRYGKAANVFLSGFSYRSLLDYKNELLNKNDKRLKKLDLFAWDNVDPMSRTH